MKHKIQESNFYEIINQAISEGRHVDYLREVLRKYKEYKQEFNRVFTDSSNPKVIYLFRVNYLRKRPVWREVEILGKQTFEDLADTIIDSMGWQNDHMHGFELPGRQKTPDPFYTGSAIAFYAPGWEDDPHPTFKSNEIRICDIDYTKQPKLSFIFDFGDNHLFDIEFKGMRKIGRKEKASYFSIVVDQRGVAPEQYPEYK